jgi:hypothetical protein
MAAACAAALAAPRPGPILTAGLDLVAADAGVLARADAGALDVLAVHGSPPPRATVLAGDLGDHGSQALEQTASEGGGSMLAVATGPPSRLALVACRADGLPFIDAESARLRAFGRIAGELLRAGAAGG